MKLGLIAFYILLLVGAVAGGTIGLVAKGLLGLLVVVHLAEFFMKREVLQKAGGSMGQHFIQVMLFGLFHWKPLEEAQQSAGSE